ncbi:hypothetical protein AN403_3105 [Pseudomonas fluorescens]|uniref:Uncharacterized protein n=1 Tax=Pseudomonas fluorescens TaxID=294 RepID=A0A0N8NX83_PSEFL|nr:hypothetical protein AN403_3105 [Pseudomonas fluorescens]
MRGFSLRRSQAIFQIVVTTLPHRRYQYPMQPLLNGRHSVELKTGIR